MANKLRLLYNTLDYSVAATTPKSKIEASSGLIHLASLFVIILTLASLGVGQTLNTDDNLSPTLVLRAKHAEGMDERTLSPDGSLLATQHRDGVIKIWDIQSTNLLRLLKAPQPVQKPDTELYGHHAFSPDGKHIASVWREPVETPKETLLVWEVSSGTARPVPMDGKFQAFRFTSDSQSLIAWDRKGRVMMWNLLNGEVKFDRQAHLQPIDYIALSADEKTLATSAHEVGEIKVWDLATQTLKKTIKVGFEGSKETTFSPDGNFLAVSSTDCRFPAMTKIYDTRTGKMFKLVDEYNQTIGFSSDSQVFASTCVCEELMLVNMKTGFEIQTQQSQGFERTIKLLESIPDLKLFRAGEIVRATFSDKTVEWNSATSKVISITDAKDFTRETEVISQHLFPARPAELYFSGFTDSALQLGISNTSVELDWQSLRVKTVPPPTSEAPDQIKYLFDSNYGFSDKRSAIRFNGKLIGIFDENSIRKEGDQEVHVPSLILKEETKDSAFGKDMIVSGDEKLIATVSHTGKAAEIIAEVDKITEARRNEEFARYEAAKARKAAGQKENEDAETLDSRNHPSNKVAEALMQQFNALSATDELQTISIWDAKTGKRLQTMRGYRGWFEAGKFLTEHQILIASHTEKAQTGNENKLVFRFWDVRTGKLLHELERSQEASYRLNLVFPPDKETFVTTQQKGDKMEIELRELQTGKIRQRFVVSNLASISENSFSKDGKRLVITEPDKSLIFDVPSGKLIATWEGELPYRNSSPFSPDGKMFVSYNLRKERSDDYNNIQLRNTETGKLMGQLVTFMDDPYVPPSPDGKPQIADKPPSFEWILFTHDGYFTCSDGAEKHFTWQVGERALPGFAYAKDFHRPDLVRKALQIQ